MEVLRILEMLIFTKLNCIFGAILITIGVIILIGEHKLFLKFSQKNYNIIDKNGIPNIIFEGNINKHTNEDLPIQYKNTMRLK